MSKRSSAAAGIAVGATIALVSVAGCGGKRSDAELLLLTWTKALNLHLATSYDEGNHYPYKLVDVDPMLRAEVGFVDPWGEAIYYRRVTDSQFDLASAGPDGEIGNDDDVVIQDRKLRKPAEAWAARPPGKTLVAQAASDKPTPGSAGEMAAGGGEAAYEEDGEIDPSYDDSEE
jgi:hypothetical protein